MTPSRTDSDRWQPGIGCRGFIERVLAVDDPGPFTLFFTPPPCRKRSKQDPFTLVQSNGSRDSCRAGQARNSLRISLRMASEAEQGRPPSQLVDALLTHNVVARVKEGNARWRSGDHVHDSASVRPVRKGGQTRRKLLQPGRRRRGRSLS